MAISGSEVHLLVLIHGMWGNPTHLAEMYRIIQEVKGKSNDVSSKLHVLLAEANKDAHTYDGIDWGGERVAQEVCMTLGYAQCAKLTLWKLDF